MKKNYNEIEEVRKRLTEALKGIESYLCDFTKTPSNFTTEVELNVFAKKTREMLASLNVGDAVPILGMWRIMETWPYKNELRQKIVEAELAYEQLFASRKRVLR